MGLTRQELDIKKLNSQQRLKNRRLKLQQRLEDTGDYTSSTKGRRRYYYIVSDAEEQIQEEENEEFWEYQEELQEYFDGLRQNHNEVVPCTNSSNILPTKPPHEVCSGCQETLRLCICGDMFEKTSSQKRTIWVNKDRSLAPNPNGKCYCGNEECLNLIHYGLDCQGFPR